jgi:hypothetical protein
MAAEHGAGSNSRSDRWQNMYCDDDYRPKHRNASTRCSGQIQQRTLASKKPAGGPAAAAGCCCCCCCCCADSARGTAAVPAVAALCFLAFKARMVSFVCVVQACKVTACRFLQLCCKLRFSDSSSVPSWRSALAAPGQREMRLCSHPTFSSLLHAHERWRHLGSAVALHSSCPRVGVHMVCCCSGVALSASTCKFTKDIGKKATHYLQI